MSSPTNIGWNAYSAKAAWASSGRQPTSCACDNCFDACVCDGYPTEQCSFECSAGPSVCDPTFSCNDCLTCGGSCYCDDPDRPLHECLFECDAGGCTTDDCSECDSCQARCECEGGDPQTCLNGYQTLQCDTSFVSESDTCACENCTPHFVACNELADCPELFECLDAANCLDVEGCGQDFLCADEIEAFGGLDAPEMGIVEALQWCRILEYCPCLGAPPN